MFGLQNYADNVNIYIVSAGINSVHADFRGINGEQASRVKAAYTVDPASPADIDIRGEGTIAAAAAAGAVYGVAKGATLHSVKVFRDDVADYTAPTQDVLDGLSWILVRHLDRPSTILFDLSAQALRKAGLTALLMQQNHAKPAVVLWLTFASTPTAHDAAKETILRNLTQAGLMVITPAGFSPVHETGPASPDACLVAVANSARSFTVSTTSRDDALASGVRLRRCLHAANTPLVFIIPMTFPVRLLVFVLTLI